MVDEVRDQSVICPHCHGVVPVRVFSRVDVGTYVGGDDEQHIRWEEGLDDLQKARLTLHRTHGLVAAYMAAFTVIGQLRNTHSAERMLMTFWESAVVRPIPPAVELVVRAEYKLGHRPIAFWAHNNVVALVAQGRFVAFFPHAYVLPSAKSKQRTYNTERIEMWIRTKHGYVPSGTLLADELRGARTVGDFAKVSQ